MAIVERPPLPRGVSVIASEHACRCESCGDTGDLLLKGKKGGLCLDCAVVVRWNIRRKRFERQGILAEPAAIERAARECLSDPNQARRVDEDVRFRRTFADAIRAQFPGCPAGRAEAIALCSAARGCRRALDADAVRLGSGPSSEACRGRRQRVARRCRDAR